MHDLFAQKLQLVYTNSFKYDCETSNNC